MWRGRNGGRRAKGKSLPKNGRGAEKGGRTLEPFDFGSESESNGGRKMEGEEEAGGALDEEMVGLFGGGELLETEHGEEEEKEGETEAVRKLKVEGSRGTHLASFHPLPSPLSLSPLSSLFVHHSVTWASPASIPTSKRKTRTEPLPLRRSSWS